MNLNDIQQSGSHWPHRRSRLLSTAFGQTWPTRRWTKKTPQRGNYQRWHWWMDCFKGKSTGIHRFSDWIWGFPVNVPSNQSIELNDDHFGGRASVWDWRWLKTVVACHPKETNHLKELVQAHRGIVDMCLGARPALGPSASSETMLGFPDTWPQAKTSSK